MKILPQRQKTPLGGVAPPRTDLSIKLCFFILGIKFYDTLLLWIRLSVVHNCILKILNFLKILNPNSCVVIVGTNFLGRFRETASLTKRLYLPNCPSNLWYHVFFIIWREWAIANSIKAWKSSVSKNNFKQNTNNIKKLINETNLTVLGFQLKIYAAKLYT